MRAVKGFVLGSVLVGAALLSGQGAWAENPDEGAAVTLAKETLAGKMGGSPDDFQLLVIVPASSTPPESRCLRARGFEAGAGWLVRLGRGTSTYDLRVSEGRAVVCDVGSVGRVESDAPPWAPGVVETGLAPQIEDARQDLARRQATPAAEIEVLEAVTVVWRDSSMGCPRKGMEYLQVLTPGVRIRLRASGRQYQYHGRRGEAPFLCKRPSTVEPLPAETS
jgi:hypothetical protein